MYYEIGILRLENPFKLDNVFTISSSTFYVEEINDEGQLVTYLDNKLSSGSYIRIVIKKSNITTWSAIEILAKLLGISPKKFGYFGLKDKNSTTYQQLSIPYSPATYERLQKLLNKNISNKISIVGFSFSNTPCNIGGNRGNFFTIIIENPHPIENLFKSIDKFSKEGILNYFGPQRFGRDLINLKISYLLIKGYLGELYRQLVEAKLIDKFNSLDFVNQIKKIDKRRRIFLFQAYQAYLFNLLLSYIKENYENVLMPGYDYLNYDVPYLNIISKILEKEGIDYHELYIPVMPELSMPSRWRKARYFPQNISIERKGEKYFIKFSLGKGEYATNLMEELFKKVIWTI